MEIETKKGLVIGMKKYETVIHIVTNGTDMYDAGERAGQFLTDELCANEEFYIFCEPTKPYHTRQQATQKSLIPAI
ncbi:hypothetical protein ACFL4E_02725 [Candidatus Omnitrophota bacterium]